MKIVADLHLHSKYSRAVSQEMVLHEMEKWAKKKGIDLLATGDWTHHLWTREIQSELVEKSDGLFGLKNNSSDILFLLSTEISSIYQQGGKLRRVHNLVFAPSFETVSKINAELVKRGCNLASDGRPIIGLSCKELAELVLSVDSSCLIVCAHAWTPWFALYGSMSGFDSIDEAFGEFSKNIYAVETGLSSDPLMNWRIKELDDRSIISFSDAHSGPKLGREATVFESSKLQVPSSSKISYEDLAKAIKQDRSSDWKIGYTIEFYPEEGKYHYTGHRNCKVKQSPAETKKLGTVCSVCGKPLTLGVMHRVEELAQRSEDELLITKEAGVVKSELFKNRPGYLMLVPLIEIISEALGSTEASGKVQFEYQKLIDAFGSEFNVLVEAPIEKIASFSGAKISEGVDKVRKGDIVIDPGYDGEYGVVAIWGEKVRQEETQKQMSLF